MCTTVVLFTVTRDRAVGVKSKKNATTGAVDADASACAVAAWGTSAAIRPWIVGNFAWTGIDYKGEPAGLRSTKLLLKQQH